MIADESGSLPTMNWEDLTRRQRMAVKRQDMTFYFFEGVATLGLSDLEKETTEEDLTKWTEMVLDWYIQFRYNTRIKLVFHDKGEDDIPHGAAGWVQYADPRFTIHLVRGSAMTKMTLLHELAHWINQIENGPHTLGHDEKFAKVLIDLVRRYAPERVKLIDRLTYWAGWASLVNRFKRWIGVDALPADVVVRVSAGKEERKWII